MRVPIMKTVYILALSLYERGFIFAIVNHGVIFLVLDASNFFFHLASLILSLSKCILPRCPHFAYNIVYSTVVLYDILRNCYHQRSQRDEVIIRQCEIGET